MDIQEFKIALEERLAKRLASQTFSEMTVGGSKLRFEMALAINGYPFELPEGAVEEDYDSLLTDTQYMSDKFDVAIDEVFQAALSNLLTDK